VGLSKFGRRSPVFFVGGFVCATLQLEWRMISPSFFVAPHFDAPFDQVFSFVARVDGSTKACNNDGESNKLLYHVRRTREYLVVVQHRVVDNKVTDIARQQPQQQQPFLLEGDNNNNDDQHEEKRPREATTTKN
jgi:hypothetical protein